MGMLKSPYIVSVHRLRGHIYIYMWAGYRENYIPVHMAVRQVSEHGGPPSSSSSQVPI